MAVKTTLTVQEDFTGEFPAAWAASGLWRFNESEPDSNDRLMDSSGNGRDFNIVNWSGTTANLLEGLRGHFFRFNINNPTSEKTYLCAVNDGSIFSEMCIRDRRYADDGAAEVVKEFQSGTLTLGVDDIGKTVAEDLTGAVIDENGVLISASEDGGAPVAIGFRAKKANGKYRYFWLYRVIFGIPATNLTTKGESIEFSTPSIEGTVTRRNKVDGQGKHPWKAEVSEDDSGVSSTVITGWYDEVYEPSYADQTAGAGGEG